MKEITDQMWYMRYDYLPRTRKSDMFHSTFEQKGQLILYAKHALGRSTSDTVFQALYEPLRAFSIDTILYRRILYGGTPRGLINPGPMA